MKSIYKAVVEGEFIDRPNRFVCHAKVKDEIVTCHMPNPGRMRELLFPGVKLFLVPHEKEGAHTAYKVVGVQKDGSIFFLDTGKCNDVAAYLVENKKIPGWESCSLVRREVTMGDSRFDLLLKDENTGEEFPVEVKSCSLSGKVGAMFPDAPTIRGVKHMKHLIELGKEGKRAGILFLVHYDKAEWFLPNMHTHKEFADTFLEAMQWVEWKAAVVHWTKDFTYPESVKLIPSCKEAIDQESQDQGYFVLCYEKKEKKIDFKEGKKLFPSPYYVLISKFSGSDEKELARLKRIHKNQNDFETWKQNARYVGAVLFRTKDQIQSLLEEELYKICSSKIENFTLTDGNTFHSEMFGFNENPLHCKRFTNMEEKIGIDRFDFYFK